MKLTWIGIVVALVVAFIIFMPRKHDFVPEQLAGVWTTANPRYTGRSFELTKGTIVFGTGEQAKEVYFISDVDKAPQRNATLYEIRCYRKEGPEEKISFFYALRGSGEIRFKNQKHIIWKKKNLPDE
ncbi:MAG: hypothetical protein JRI36_05790 [Deltaproteobacteria bacterium]|nr:hypothetical protein [Deltaproteobacteria bacterium]